jgi:hypothetical protein
VFAASNSSSLVCATNAIKEDRCRRSDCWCGAASEMEGPAGCGWWSSAAALQGEAANHRKLLRSRAVVVSVCGKVVPLSAAGVGQ